MELRATARRDGQPVACGYGAALEVDGRLSCGLLFVMRHQQTEKIFLRCPDTGERYRVRLPRELLGARGHAIARNITLEVIE